MKKRLDTIGSNAFEELKKFNTHGAEYWSARDLQPLLGYTQWRHFENAIKRSMVSCKQSGNNPYNHFVVSNYTYEVAPNKVRTAKDYYLSRFACYLIVQNGDSRKPEIANAQKYFVIQARRQEISDVLAADVERVYVRQQTSKLFRALSGAAKNAGIQDDMFGVFHEAGYRGLYGGLNPDAIKAVKGIPKTDQLMDRMGTTELAANQFRMTQTRDKLAREQVNNPLHAILTHQVVGQEVRQAIQRIGGAMPESLAPAEHIKQVKKRIAKASQEIKLDGENAKGLNNESTD